MRAIESYFQLTSYVVEESKIQIKEPLDIEKIRFHIDMSPQFSEPIRTENEITAEVTLELTIKGYSKRRLVRNIYLRIRGAFLASPPIEKEKFDKLCRLNGVMILMMLARSYIATTTAQMGIKPVIIPMINLTRMPILKQSN